MTAKIAGDAMQNGLFMFPWIDTLILAPPLIITKEEVDQAIAIIDKSLEIGDKEVESTDVPLSKSCEYE